MQCLGAPLPPHGMVSHPVPVPHTGSSSTINNASTYHRQNCTIPTHN